MSIETKPVNGTTRPNGVRLTRVTTMERGTPAAASTKDAPPRDATWKRTARVVWHAARHERARDGARLAARHGMYVAGGVRILWRRSRDGRTPARYERMMRIAEAAGDAERVAEWEERGRSYREQRSRRRKEMLATVREAPQVAAAGVGTAAVGLLALGGALAWAQDDITQVVAPTMFLIDLIGWLTVIGSVVWDLVKLFGVPLAVLALWDVGRRQQAAPAWALPTTQRQRESEVITPHRVVLALRHLGISPLRKAILGMEDGGASMLSPIVIAGSGVEVDVTLPLEVSTEEIQAKRKKLAENLGRHEHELHITIPQQARAVRLWIADSGALDEPIGPSPLVLDSDITADYKTGKAPWGLDLRGDAAEVPVYQRHVLATGASNQGKTAALRALALWLAFDPRVEFRIADLKGIGDWRMFDGLATVLIEGPTDDHVAAATQMLEDGVAEMNRRLMAPAGTTWDPLILIVDEAQKAFMCPAKGPDGRPYGGKKGTSRYFMAARELHNQGRAVDVLLWQGTQDPTDENLPKLVREGAHIRASLALGTESQSEMALGEDAVDAGAAPHKLRKGIDKGQLVAAGDLGKLLKPGQGSINIRTHFVDTDPAHEVAERAKERRSPVDTSAKVELVEERDPLKDLAVITVGEKRLRTPEAIHRLKSLAHDFYRDWDGRRLRRALTDAGEDTGTYDGYPVVIRERVLRALANRDGSDSET